ncbi:hypothetical protein [Flavobacterium sp.]|jgi:hypothetical protein|uniref:hypothetical protein n=1 Tax=Flavobacterium sp. TaxID=239 RepID=UPI002A834302|nr:hypothetical protein [Flavobacterium sp.]
MKKTTLLLFIAFLCYNFVSAQESKTSNYNLPPGCVLKQKVKLFDLSYKLEGKSSTHNFSQSDLAVIKDIPLSEIENYKNIDLSYYNYYKEGLSFFDSLSSKVKQTFTITELWYIYVFDQDLKNKLITIK